MSVSLNHVNGSGFADGYYFSRPTNLRLRLS